MTVSNVSNAFPGGIVIGSNPAAFLTVTGASLAIGAPPGVTGPQFVSLQGTGGGSTGGFVNHIPTQGFQTAEGANAKQGTGTLVAGSLVVANTSVTANSRIFLTSQADGGTPGFLRVSARTPGTSFTVTSSSAADTSTFAYEIFEPG